jgi:hypothetical protein
MPSKRSLSNKECVPNAGVMHPSTSSNEPLEPGKGRVAEVVAEACVRCYTLGFHHLRDLLVMRNGGFGVGGGLHELNWKDEEQRWVWVRRSF